MILVQYNSHISIRIIYTCIYIMYMYLHILHWTIWCLDCLSICLGTNIGLGFIFAKVIHRNNKLLPLFYWSCQYMYVSIHIQFTSFYPHGDTLFVPQAFDRWTLISLYLPRGYVFSGLVTM